jgi:hypothetical protein
VAKRKLPPKKDATQVWAEVDKIFNSAPMMAYHGAIPDYRALTLSRLSPEVPDSFARGTTMDIPSTRVLEVVSALLAKAAGFVRYTDMVAKAEKSGVPSQKLVERADRGGRSLTVMNATLDPAKRKTRALNARQLVDGWAVMHLHRRGRPGRGFNWDVEIADPLTCAFPEEEGGAFVPKRLARKFLMQLSAAQASYASRGTLTRVAGGAFDWKPLAAVRAIDEGPATNSNVGPGSSPGTENRDDVEVEVGIYEDGAYVYHVIRDPGTPTSSSKPETLYCERNNCHKPQKGDEDYEADCGVMAVVVPGDTFAFGSDGEKMLPVMFSVLNIVNNINLVMKIRGSMALRDKPDMVASFDGTPEDILKLQQVGAIQPTAEDATGPGIIYQAGKDMKMTPWQVVANQDLDKIIEDLAHDLEVAVAELIVNTDPNVVAAATASAYHISSSEQSQRHANWLQAADFGWAAIDQMICNATVNDDDEYDFVASEAQPRSGSKEVPKGEHNKLSPDDLDFDYDITVATKQETEDQKNKRLLNAIFLKDQGIRTLVGVIAEDTVDVTARLQELFEDKVRMVAQPVLLTQFLPSVLEQYIRTGAGAYIPLSRPENAAMFMPQQQQMAAPSPQPTNTFAPAPTEPEAGGAEVVEASAI